MKYLIKSLFYLTALHCFITALKYLIKYQFYLINLKYLIIALKYLITALKKLIKSLFYLITLKYLITVLKASFGKFARIISPSHISPATDILVCLTPDLTKCQKFLQSFLMKFAEKLN